LAANKSLNKKAKYKLLDDRNKPLSTNLIKKNGIGHGSTSERISHSNMKKQQWQQSISKGNSIWPQKLPHTLESQARALSKRQIASQDKLAIFLNQPKQRYKSIENLSQ